MTYAQDVRTNYMPGTDFPKYHTYAWVDEVKGVPRVGGQPDPIMDTQVKQAVDSQMAAKGLTKVDSDKADLLLGYQLAIDREKRKPWYRTQNKARRANHIVYLLSLCKQGVTGSIPVTSTRFS
ncbi:MAG: DUF4136 domain-containing protein [Candidatus Acidiferrales bacterium]